MIRSAPCRRAAGDRPESDHAEAEDHDGRPGSTCARYIAAPRPVDSPHANRHAASSAASGLIFASEISLITVASANVEQPMKWRSSSPSRDSRALPSGR